MPGHLRKAGGAIACCVTLGLWALPLIVLGQVPTDTTSLYSIETIDGNAFVGEILDDDGVRIILATEDFGELTIQRANIRSLRRLEAQELRGREAWLYHPQSTRYFYAPTAYGLRKGEGYYQNVWVFFNQFAYGITDNLSIGGGIIPLFLFNGAPTPIWITPKVSVPIVEDKLALGGGALLGTVLGDVDNGFFGIPYGIFTLGNRNNNFSVGLGYGFIGGDFADAPTLEINGMFRISPKSYLLTENLILPEDGQTLVILSVGGRTVWTGVSLDYGLVIPTETSGEVFALPWLGLVVPFGRRQGLGPTGR